MERKHRGGVGNTPVKNRRGGGGSGDSGSSARTASLDCVRDALSPKLMKLVQHIAQTLPGDHKAVGQSADFPVLAGSHLPMNNPALEFVKFVCHVIGLDSSVVRRPLPL